VEKMAVREAAPLKLWRNSAFSIFWVARTVSYAGTGITMVVLPVLVYQRTGSPAAVASLAGIEVMPYLALGLFAGALADRVNPRKVMLVCDATAALLLGTVPAAAAFHVLVAAQLFIVAIGIATVFVWFDAANFRALPTLVERSQLPSAVGMVGSSGSIALLIGPAIGASLMTVMTPANVLGLDAASYVASASLIATLRHLRHRQSQVSKKDTYIRTDIAEGLKFLWHQRVVRTMTIAVFAICVSWGGTFGLLVVYATRALHLVHSDVRLGLLYSGGELGGFVSAITVPRIVNRAAIGRLTTVLIIANAVLLVLLATVPGYGWALLLFSCYELTYVLVTTVGITLRQMLTPDDLQGRVNTTGRLIAWCGQPVGALLGGVLAELMPIGLVFGLMAIGTAVGAGLAVWSCLRSGPLSRVSIPVHN
jgi:MFS family permease